MLKKSYKVVTCEYLGVPIYWIQVTTTLFGFRVWFHMEGEVLGDKEDDLEEMPFVSFSAANKKVEQLQKNKTSNGIHR